MKTARLAIGGMTCSHCVSTVENALRARKGVRTAKAHLNEGAAEVEYDENVVAPEQLIVAVEESGYSATFPGAGR
jgi:copper chaperone CopZ